MGKKRENGKSVEERSSCGSRTSALCQGAAWKKNKQKKQNKRKTRNMRSRTDREVCREILPCATRWRGKKNKKSVGHHLCNEFSFRSVPCGGVRMEGDKQTIFKDIEELLGVFFLL